jgi:8-oxo-dGTP diphosphatase
MKIEKVIVASDIIIENTDGSIILVKRANEPFINQWALPGGIMEPDETIEQTAVREVKEETGLDVNLTHLIGVYTQPDRDPRGRAISVLYSAKIIGGTLSAGSDAQEVLTTKDFSQIQLAFDHNQMLIDYLKYKKA